MNQREAIIFAIGRIRSSRAALDANYRSTGKLTRASQDRITASLLAHTEAIEQLQQLLHSLPPAVEAS